MLALVQLEASQSGCGSTYRLTVVIGRQLRQHFAIDIVVAECRRVLFEPQPA